MFTRMVIVGWLAGFMGCASAPEPATWYSASCEMRADLRTVPTSAREVAETAFGPVVLTTHRSEHEGEVRVFGCREVPVSWLNRIGAKTAAKEALGVDAAGLGEGWSRSAQEDQNESQSETFDGPKGQKAWLRAWSDRVGRIFGEVIIASSEEAARAYRQSVDGRGAAFSPGSLVRSAECLSGVPMPQWPEGTFAGGVATLSHSETKSRMERVWQLRCVILGEALKVRGASALFAEAVDDTVASGDWTVTEQRDGTLGAHASRDLTFASKDGGALMVARLVFDGERLHMVTFAVSVETGGTAAGALDASERAAVTREGVRFREALVLWSH